MGVTLLEEFVAGINRGIYYRDFSFTKTRFTPLPGQPKGFADHVI